MIIVYPHNFTGKDPIIYIIISTEWTDLNLLVQNDFHRNTGLFMRKVVNKSHSQERALQQWSAFTFTRAIFIHSLPKSIEKTAALVTQIMQQTAARPTNSEHGNLVFISSTQPALRSLPACESTKLNIPLVSHVCCGCGSILLERVVKGKPLALPPAAHVLLSNVAWKRLQKIHNKCTEQTSAI